MRSDDEKRIRNTKMTLNIIKVMKANPYLWNHRLPRYNLTIAKFYSMAAKELGIAGESLLSVSSHSNRFIDGVTDSLRVSNRNHGLN